MGITLTCKQAHGCYNVVIQIKHIQMQNKDVIKRFDDVVMNNNGVPKEDYSATSTAFFMEQSLNEILIYLKSLEMRADIVRSVLLARAK